jgi:translation initiation factor IF-3
LRINDGIRAPELRVLLDEGESKVMKKADALALAQDMGLDLIEISANAKPPVAKITDYGKFVYDQKKKQKEIKSKQHTVEVKQIQIRMGTDTADLEIKAKKATEWLLDNQRVKAELYLKGRSKYMDKKFLHDRLGKVLSLITADYKVVEDFKISPKGIAILIEPDKTKKKDEKTPDKVSDEISA